MDQAEQLRIMMKIKNQQKPKARVITVTSGKGGVGKTSVSVNLAIQLQKLGKRVVMLDADFGLANVEVMFGIRPQYNLADLVFRGKNIKEIITEGPMGVGFISGGSGIQELSNLNKEQIQGLSYLLADLDELADIIIVDTGAGIANSVMEFVSASSEVLLVVTPEPTSITDAYALLKALNKNVDFLPKETTIKLIANRVESMEDGKRLFLKLNTVIQKFLDVKVEYLGAVPQDKSLMKAVMQQKPVSISFPNAVSTRAVGDLAARLEDGKETDKIERKGIVQLLSGLIKTRQRK